MVLVVRGPVTLKEMLEVLPGEDLVPWRLPAADLLVGTLAVVAFGFLLRRAVRDPANLLVGRRAVRFVAALLFAALVVLAGRRFYGPPIRLLLTAPVDRPTQRFSDRVARSPELRAWYARRAAALRAAGEADDMVPRSLAGERAELIRFGFARLNDAQLKTRTDLLARTLARASDWTCISILTGDETAVPNVLSRFDGAAADTWGQLVLDAMVAQAQGAPPSRRLTRDERRPIVAELPGRGAHGINGRSFESFRTPTESGSERMRDRCDRERRLYAEVSGWDGPRRTQADLLLATADAYLMGDFDEQGAEP